MSNSAEHINPLDQTWFEYSVRYMQSLYRDIGGMVMAGMNVVSVVDAHTVDIVPKNMYSGLLLGLIGLRELKRRFPTYKEEPEAIEAILIDD